MSLEQSYSDVQLYIDGEWRDGSDGRQIDVVNPATGEVIGRVAHATTSDLDAALPLPNAASRLGAPLPRSSATRSCARRPNCCANAPMPSPN